MLRLFCFFVFILASTAYSQVYQGTIGKYPIVFELVSEDEGYQYQARYYYTKVKTDIFLNRAAENANVYYTHADDASIRETFKLKILDKKISGTWSQGNNKLNISLNQVDTSQLAPAKTSTALQELRSTDIYGYLKLHDIGFTKTKEEKWDATTTLEWYKEELTQVEFFRIKSSTYLKDPSKINHLLREKHIEEVVNAISCILGSPGPGEYYFSGKLTYLSSSLISVYYQVNNMCYGARAWLSLGGITMDCASLQPLQLHDLFWLKDTEASKTAWHTLVKTHYAEDMEMKSDDQCNYDDINVWNMGKWVLTKQGLHIDSYLHTNPHCSPDENEWPVVPYKDLVKYRVNKEKYVLE